jgi:hypothetical protein
LVAWLVAASVMIGTCVAYGYPPFSPTRTWERWDSGLYLSIAGSGYSVSPCGTSGFGAGTMCGNAGWFPAYSWLIGALHLLGLPLAPTALALSWLAYLAALVVIWMAFLRDRPWLVGALALAYAAVAPGLVYNFAIFPLSLVTLCTVSAFALVQRGRLVWAGIAAAFAALAYPLGMSIIPAGVVLLLWPHAKPIAQRARDLLAFSGPPVAALGLFLVDQRLETGHWNAYLLVQKKYQHALADPITAITSALDTVLHGAPIKLSAAAEVHTVTPALQTLFVALVGVCVLVALALRRHSVTQLEAMIAVWAVVEWAFGHAVVDASNYRAEALSLPLVLLLPRLPRLLVAEFVLAAVALFVPLTRLFLDGVLL